MNMRVLSFAVLIGSLLWADLEQRVESRVRLSMTVGDSLVQYRPKPICPYVACSQCAKRLDDLKRNLRLQPIDRPLGVFD